MARITKKLREAAFTLGGERLGDCGEDAILDAVRRGEVTREQVYQAMERLGYAWTRGGWPFQDWYWRRNIPQWLKAIRRRQRA
jgi:hypothetical protein